MIKLRPLVWPEDRASLLALDTSFMADRVYRLERTGRSFALQEVTVMPPVNKSYPLASEINALSKYDWVQVAEEFGAIVGLVAMGIEGWNRRASNGGESSYRGRASGCEQAVGGDADNKLRSNTVLRAVGV